MLKEAIKFSHKENVFFVYSHISLCHTCIIWNSENRTLFQVVTNTEREEGSRYALYTNSDQASWYTVCPEFINDKACDYKPAYRL
jgi:hypothetical protein